MKRGVVALFLLAVPAWVEPVSAQDRAAELEARRAARVEALGGAGDGWTAAWLDPWGQGWRTDCAPWSEAGLRDGTRGGWACDPWSSPWGALHGHGRGFGYGYGWDAYGPRGWGLLPSVPNPYRDWASLWGRGWLDGGGVPPYHRFQYRFFPETLPDPTARGYIEPRLEPGTLPPVLVTPPGRPCARIEITDVDGQTEVFGVPLPALGAGDPATLRSRIEERLRRGGGVTVRDLDGYVRRFPPPDRIRELRILGC